MTLGALLGGFALQVALEDLGKGEDCDHGGIHRNNCGEFVRLVRGDAKRAAWCASAVGNRWFREAAHRMHVKLPFVPSHSARRLFKRMVAGGGVRVTQLSAGDVVLWARPPNPFSGHIGIVSRVEAGGIFHALEGNRGPNAKVAEFPHTLSERRLLGFVRI